MNSAVIFIKDNEERQLAKAPYRGGNLLLHTIKELRKIEEIKEIFMKFKMK